MAFIRNAGCDGGSIGNLRGNQGNLTFWYLIHKRGLYPQAVIAPRGYTEKFAVIAEI